LSVIASAGQYWKEKKEIVLTSDLPAGLSFKLLHVGVAVPALDPAAESLATLFGYKVVSGPFDDPIQKVTVNFLTTSDDDRSEIELIAPLGEDSPVRSMLAKGGGGAYHLCFETNDLEAALVHMQRHGCIVVSQPVPAVAFQNRRIAWIYTRSRQLFELVEGKAAG
jgi:methylmalonyl-CoA/ethylmalonyl-CoA epimerase